MNYTPPVIDESRYPKSRIEIIDMPINLSRVSKADLVEELSKRDGVKMASSDLGAFCSDADYKHATILVIR